ncbi:MAG: alpha/beta hydrolase [Microbacterium sp. 69-10]|uniref:alpha/beta fold hydrolase n=1 Tax=Microbacterium sp. 69-10 TaxID=1895783 RepID=UPI0009625B63|nr:alpha/beta hydrolase [Microbacterium sp. 69-10]OJU39754.1 MAG: alpha/beta hydrolase [Microbacterium sp. 69-10]
MDLLLIPGFWLDSDSWKDVVPALEGAGHHVHPLTMPGVGVPATGSADIGMADWVAAAVARIDELDGPIALIGHSGGGNVVWGAADARPDRVSRVVFVDTVPPAPGRNVGEFDVVDGVVPFPGWDYFPDEDVYDLDDATRARTAPLTLSIPARVPADPIELTDEHRHAVPVTLLMGGLDQTEFEMVIKEWGPFAEEFAAIENAEVIKLGSGHWPQFSKPDVLAREIVTALSR